MPIVKSRAVGALLLISLTFCGSLLADEPSQQDQRIVQQAKAVVDAFHGESREETNNIHVVYFHASDREPLDQWRPRTERILKDVSEFYESELAEYGIESNGLPFAQTDDGSYLIHLVTGKLRSDQYDYDSGRVVQREIEQSLSETIDFRRADVLAIHGLCDIADADAEQPRYVFHAPYYGLGTQQSGFCHAADCELLDPQLLSETKREIRFTEHYYPLRVQTVAAFNSWYLGGVAHELGHGIGLPHDRGSPNGRWERGTSLMGMGNLTYRENIWGGKKPSYLSTGTALRLIASPLLTQSNKDRFTDARAQIAELDIEREATGGSFSGKIESSVECYALIASLWRKTAKGTGGDHLTTTFPVLVNNGNFQVNVPTPRSGDYRLQFSILLVNGACRNINFQMPVTTDRGMDLDTVRVQNAFARIVARIKSGTADETLRFDEQTIAGAVDPTIQAQMRVLNGLIGPSALIDLTTTTEKQAYLSDANWDDATVGWGKVARNHHVLDAQRLDKLLLRLDDRPYTKGLYAHSKSKFRFQLGKRWKTFSATIGLQAGAHLQGSAVFTVVADGKTIYRSPVLRTGKSQAIHLDLTDVDAIELIAEGGEGHVHSSWAIWADAQVTRE